MCGLVSEREREREKEIVYVYVFISIDLSSIVFLFSDRVSIYLSILYMIKYIMNAITDPLIYWVVCSPMV